MNGLELILGLLAGLTVSLVAYYLMDWRVAAGVKPWRALIGRLLRDHTRALYDSLCQQAGLRHWQAADLVALKIAWTAGTATTLAWLSGSVPLTVLSAVIVWFACGLWVRQRIKHNQAELTNELPLFLDLLSMCLRAGMNLQTGVQLVVRYQHQTPLTALWQSWLLQVRSGATRTDAFKQMLAKMRAPALRRICVALIQAEELGSGMAASLLVHSKQLRHQRLMDAEKQALQAPVKMLLPLVVCFFPCTFLVLGFSIYVNLGAMFD